jgi:hypothetical protein
MANGIVTLGEIAKTLPMLEGEVRPLRQARPPQHSKAC